MAYTLINDSLLGQKGQSTAVRLLGTVSVKGLFEYRANFEATLFRTLFVLDSGVIQRLLYLY